MFYPVDSLKRGGRFYLCWVADSWPLRFATITHRQLWSQDIRRICDDLLEVMNTESGRPSNRFSLRLSSQLMRGLVRLYQRKVTVFLSDLCMINANCTKNVNKKWNIQEIEVVTHRPLPQLAPQQLVIQEEPENEQRIEEIIQNSGNVVGNIQEITLKESTIPQLQLPANDGFGEENPDQALQLVANQTLEMMLVQDASAIQHSGLELALDTTGDKSHNKSHDKSRAQHDAPVMERIEELDVTMFQKSVTAEDRLTMGGLEKDVPDIPEIQLPDLPGQPPALQIVQEPQVPAEEVPIPEVHKPQQEDALEKEQEVVEIELEELEAVEPAAKRRRLKKLIVDKKIRLAAEYLRARIQNPYVELRCDDSSDDIIAISVPAEVYFRRCAHAGPRYSGGVGRPLARLFQRNLGVFNREDFADRDMEQAVAERTRRPRTRSVLERIEEEKDLPAADRPQAQIDQPVPELDAREYLNMTEAQNITLPQETNVVEPPNVTMQPEDIADLPTQKVEVLSQTRKRTSDYEVSPKRQRLIGYVSFRQSQQTAIEAALDIEAEKENIPSAANVQRVTRQHLSQESPEKSLTVMLQAAGLADLPPPRAEEPEQPRVEPVEAETRPTRKGSDSDETQLGSLDRTKVSLGDSDQTTDSKRFIREQWGTEGTMVKILGAVKATLRPLTVRRLVTRGPALRGCGALVAARCFTSILKLKQHGFIIIEKDPETLEIRDILLGPKFDQVQ